MSREMRSGEDACFQRLVSLALSPEAKRRLAEMCAVIWVRSKNDTSRQHHIDVAKLRTTLSLASDDVRGAVAWQFSTLFPPTREANELSAAIAWRRYGTAFFLEIWPLEPTLQSARSANDFAAIPVNVGVDFFSEAVDTILPHLLPFDVWAVSSEFDLDAKDEGAQKLISALPEGVLTLLAACINERQQHGVFELTEVLDLIQAADSELRRDSRMRQLRRLAVS